MSKIFFLSYLLISSTHLFSLSENEINSRLKNISFFDRYCMKVFFEEAIEHDVASHILFHHSKPACNICISIRYPGRKFREKLALRGWYVLKENEYLFPHPNFILVDYYYGDSNDFRLVGIDFIHKSPLKVCLSKYQALFAEVLGADFSPDKFISELEKGVPLKILLNQNEKLLGIVLGFGKESAEAYEYMVTKYSDNMPPPQTETYCRIDLKTPKDCKIDPVVFMGNPQSQEVKKLKHQYENELVETWKHSKGKKLSLNLVLQELTRESREFVIYDI